MAMARRLMELKSVGEATAQTLSREVFYRDFRNRRQIGSYSGLTPSPYQSGETDHDQGITRAGNAHVRRVIVQLAWGWIRHQPDSALTHWYRQRFGGGGKRVRKIGIVALARRLLIALWRYLETGVVPDGAQLKPIEV
jgi:transposase